MGYVLAINPGSVADTSFRWCSYHFMLRTRVLIPHSEKKKTQEGRNFSIF